MKNITKILTLVFLTASTTTFSQIAINTSGADPHPSAMLDVSSTKMGVLFPRITSTERMNITPLTVGLMVFDTDQGMLMYYTGTEWNKFSTGHLWSETSGGDITWLTNYTGAVGIGTKTPTGDLEVMDSSSIAMLRITSKAHNAVLAINRHLDSDMSSIIWQTAGADQWYSGLLGSENYSVSRATSEDGTFFIHTSGNVGIGTTNPNRNLQITGDASMGSLLITPKQSVSEGSSEILLAEDLDFTFGMQIKYDGVANKLHFFGKNGLSYIGPYMTIERTGDIGIGTDNPIYPFHVYSENENGSYFETETSGVPIVIEQHSTDDMLIGYGPNGGSKEFSISSRGRIEILNSNGHKTVDINPSETGTDDGGQITLYNAGGTEATIEIDGSYSGDGRITTNELQITGGSDLSELFDLSDYDRIQKGMVVSIDPSKEGHLKISEEPYDKSVAGIISGANDIETGLIMSQRGSIADGEHLVALSGRVYCLVDADIAPVEAGDLLTTSRTPGYAMKAKNRKKAHGSIIGKAMTSLEEGKGLVLVLVTLQ